MAYRDWQRKHPSWPKKVADVKGRNVRLLQQLQTRGGDVFPKGLEMKIEGVYRGRLYLVRLTDHRSVIRQVDVFDVELL